VSGHYIRHHKPQASGARLRSGPADPQAPPFVFATGYGELPEPYRDRPTLKKPFQMDGLKQMLQSALE
jgi:hypothetical protein